MFSPRTRALISERDALQSARSRLFLRLDLLTDTCDVETFCDVLADVATLHAQHDGTKGKTRERWQALADSLDRNIP